MDRKMHRIWLGIGSVALILATFLEPTFLPGIGQTQAATVSGTITLTPSLPSPQPVGTPISWTATSTDPNPLVYQFSVSQAISGPFMVTRDFSPRNVFTTTPLVEGAYYIRVVVKEGYTSTLTAAKQAPFTLSSRVIGGQPVVNTTANAQVALYSAPPCTAGQMAVIFKQVGVQGATSTNSEPCVAGQSRNFWVAGMVPQATYQMRNVVTNGSTIVTSTKVLTFTTGSLPAGLTFPNITEPVPPTSKSDIADGLLLHSMVPTVASAATLFATNLAGQIAWYSNQSDITETFPLRLQSGVNPAGSEVFVAGNDGQQANGDNVLRTIDLAGNPLQETNVQVVNAQLAARGQQPIYGFHHDAFTLPSGATAVLGYTQQTVAVTTTPYIGDMLIVLNRNFQVAWTWDEFACPNCASALSPSRGPTLNDTCGPPIPALVCPVPAYPNVVDFTHANGLGWSVVDNNIIISLRTQDWVIKINYKNGTGDGSILWRLGPGGDFTLVPLSSAGSFPWFSHQHNPNYLNPQATSLVVFDNGNVRCNNGQVAGCHSRGQVYVINEAARIVTQTLNVDVGGYSGALGTAQRLSNGNYNFTLGQEFPPPPFAQDVEEQADGSGTQDFVQNLTGQEYRAWRFSSLYSSVNPLCPSCQ